MARGPIEPGILPPGVKVVPFLDRSDLVHLTTHTVLHNLTEGIILVSVILFVFLGNIRGALIVTLTIPFALLFASICLQIAGIPANLLSLGALDFGMIVEGAVVMIENIVRLLSHPGGEHADETVGEKIRSAAHEVQRPVFYSIAIIITAYLPIFTLQAVEGRLFKPMAWTVAFALLGALIFSMLVGPVIAAVVYPKGTKEWHNPLMGFLTRMYDKALGVAIRWRWATVGLAAADSRRNRRAEPRASDPSFCRTWTKAPSGCAARWRPAPARAEGIAIANRARILLCSFPEVPQCTSQVGRPDDGTDTTGFFNTEFFVDLKPKEQWRPVFHQNKEELIAGDEQGAGEDPGRDLELLPADRRQHGGSGQRSEGRAGGEAVWDRLADAGKPRPRRSST